MPLAVLLLISYRGHVCVCVFVCVHAPLMYVALPAESMRNVQ